MFFSSNYERACYLVKTLKCVEGFLFNWSTFCLNFLHLILSTTIFFAEIWYLVQRSSKCAPVHTKFILGCTKLFGCTEFILGLRIVTRKIIQILKLTLDILEIVMKSKKKSCLQVYLKLVLKLTLDIMINFWKLH